MKYLERRPGPELREIVECVWMVSDPLRRGTRAPERIVPDACPEIIVHLGDPFFRQVGRRWNRQPRAFLAGTLTRPWMLRPGARVATLGMRFRPGAVRALFPALDLALATDREVPLGEIAGPRPTRGLGASLRTAVGVEARLACAEGWLLERLAAVPRRAPRLTEAAVALVRRTRGGARIEAVAARLEVGQRRLERAFRRDLGIRPKLFARIVRLHAVLARLDAEERESAVDLALAAGYFDQSHLLRDFRGVAGRSPRAARAGDGEMARHFTRPDRVLAWLAGE